MHLNWIERQHELASSGHRFVPCMSPDPGQFHGRRLGYEVSSVSENELLSL